MTRARLLAAGLATLAAAGLAGCGGGGTATPKTTHAPTTAAPPAATKTAPHATPSGTAAAGAGACLVVKSALDKAILRNVVLSGARFEKVRAARAAVPGFYYVTGSMSGAGTKHLLATWATQGLNGHQPIYAVDANAALVSAYGASTQLTLDLSITAPGAHHSRICVAGKGASAGLPAPVGGTHGAPAGQ